MSISGIGYEGLDLEGFISRVHLRGIDMVVDVRLNAMSRKRGFSKKSLSTALRQSAVEYVHMPALGNERDNRAGFSELGTVTASQARQVYRDRLALPSSQPHLKELMGLVEAQSVAVLCFEADESHCHRQQLIKYLEEQNHATIVKH